MVEEGKMCHKEEGGETHRVLVVRSSEPGPGVIDTQHRSIATVEEVT